MTGSSRRPPPSAGRVGDAAGAEPERAQGIAERYTTKMRRKDGSFVPLPSAPPRTDQHGEVVGTLAVVIELGPAS